MRHKINQSHNPSMGHSGSSSYLLLMLVSEVVQKKTALTKRCDKEEEEHEFLGVFDVFLK